METPNYIKFCPSCGRRQKHTEDNRHQQKCLNCGASLIVTVPRAIPPLPEEGSPAEEARESPAQEAVEDVPVK